MTCKEFMAIRGALKVRLVADTELLAVARHAEICQKCKELVEHCWNNEMTEADRKIARTLCERWGPKLHRKYINDPEEQ